LADQTCTATQNLQWPLPISSNLVVYPFDWKFIPKSVIYLKCKKTWVPSSSFLVITKSEESCWISIMIVHGMHKVVTDERFRSVWFVLYGDGSTLRQIPLLNILASGAHVHTASLEIINSASHQSIFGRLGEGGS
jgi:hypothetical protein